MFVLTCNAPAVEFFLAIPAGAWEYAGMGGFPVGVKPESLAEIRLLQGIELERWREIAPDVRILEETAVQVMRERREEMGRK